LLAPAGSRDDHADGQAGIMADGTGRPETAITGPPATPGRKRRRRGANIEDAINELETLRETLHDGDSGSLRDVLREFVSKIALWFDWKEPEAGKKRGKCEFRDGFIHLRPDLQVFRLVSSAHEFAV